MSTQCHTYQKYTGSLWNMNAGEYTLAIVHMSQLIKKTTGRVNIINLKLSSFSLWSCSLVLFTHAASSFKNVNVNTIALTDQGTKWDFHFLGGVLITFPWSVEKSPASSSSVSMRDVEYDHDLTLSCKDNTIILMTWIMYIEKLLKHID